VGLERSTYDLWFINAHANDDACLSAVPISLVLSCYNLYWCAKNVIMWALYVLPWHIILEVVILMIHFNITLLLLSIMS